MEYGLKVEKRAKFGPQQLHYFPTLGAPCQLKFQFSCPLGK